MIWHRRCQDNGPYATSSNQIKKKALHNLISQKILKAKAKAKKEGLEVHAKVPEPTRTVCAGSCCTQSGFLAPLS
jgi:hypothetical protein